MNLFDRLSELEWTALATIGTAASAVASVLGLVFVGIQIRSATKIADIELLQGFIETTTRLERAMLDSESEQDRDTIFWEYLNYLEFLAGGLRKRIFPGLSREFIREKLLDAVALIEVYPVWTERLDRARSTPEALVYISAIRIKERRRLETIKKHLQAAARDSSAVSDPGAT